MTTKRYFDAERACDYPDIDEFENSYESPEGGLLQNLPHDDDERWLKCELASPFFYDGD
jgi:hypothetical protein